MWLLLQGGCRVGQKQGAQNSWKGLEPVTFLTKATCWVTCYQSTNMHALHTSEAGGIWIFIWHCLNVCSYLSAPPRSALQFRTGVKVCLHQDLMRSAPMSRTPTRIGAQNHARLIHTHKPTLTPYQLQHASARYGQLRRSMPGVPATHSRPAECNCHRARHIECTLRGQAHGLSRGPLGPAGSRHIQQTSSWSCWASRWGLTCV